MIVRDRLRTVHTERDRETEKIGEEEKKKVGGVEKTKGEKLQ